MSQNNLSITLQFEQIFKPIQHFQSRQRSQTPVIISDELYLNQLFQGRVSLQLTSNALYMKKFQNQWSMTHLNFSVKFLVILQNEENIKSKKIGFKIIKDNCSQIYSFYSPNQFCINQWVLNLRTKINQIGFHKNFKPLRRLGKGQFATVFQVQNLQNGHKFAVKAFSKTHLSKTPKGMDSLINQIKIMRSFSHKNLQKLQCVYESQNSIYLVNQLLQGGSLFDRTNKLNHQNKKFSIQNLREFMSGLLMGLEKLNQLNIVHRDLKLDNIMLRHSNNFQPVIIDFGLATFSQEPQYLYYRCGTPGYVSPQVMSCSKNKKTQSISDIFSAGAIFHHILTNKPLFEGNTTEQVLGKNKKFQMNFRSSVYDQISQQAMDLLQRMLQIDSNKRIKASESMFHQFFNQNEKICSPVLTTADLKQYKIISQFSNY